jgi:type II secretory pathway pseudopilin PulG
VKSSATIRINHRATRGERGYAMLMVMMMATLMLITATAVSINYRTEGTRQREQELAWRGNQYVRAIRLYFKKNGRFPKSLEDLTKYTSSQPRYIRKAYKDPMNTEDGSWRLIYVTPNGVLIGSVMHKTLYAGGLPGIPQQGQPGTPGSTTNPPGGTTPPGGMTPPGQIGGPPTQQPGQGTDPNQPGQSTGATGSGTIGSGPMFGGQLIGVGSKVQRDSVRVLDGGTSYIQWEFIWDPTKPGNMPTSTTGTSPGGTTKPPPGPGANPPPNPPQQNPQ